MVNCETNTNGSIANKNEKVTKKKSKQKRTTLNFNEYVKRVSGPGPLPTLSIRRSRLDDLSADVAESTRLALSRIVLPTAPKSSCKIDIDDSKLPSEPPYMINISNLPYEFEDEELHSVFDHIAHIDVTRDDSKKSKGYARVELETKEALVNALNLTEVLLRGRRLRVDLYEAHGSRRGFDGGSGGSHDDYNRRYGSGGAGSGSSGSGGGGSSELNWRSGLSSRQAVSSTTSANASSAASSGSWRDNQQRPASSGNEPSSSRGFNNKYSYRGQHNKDSNNTSSTNASGSQTATDDALNYNWRQNNNNNNSSSNNSSNNFGDSKFTNSSSSSSNGALSERPKLKLCPRTKPLNNDIAATITTTTSAPAPALADDSAANGNLRNSSESLSDRGTTSVGDEHEPVKKNKPSIFGNAKPVDTATKERQIELQLLESRARSTAAVVAAPVDSESVEPSTASTSPSQAIVESSSVSNGDSDQQQQQQQQQQPNKKLYRPPNRRNN